jgi:predicted DNA-binding transcriptional regulator AlpA
MKTSSRPQDVAAAMGISVALLYHKVATDPRFPKPHKVFVGGRASVFDDDELLRYKLGQAADTQGMTETAKAAWVEAQFVAEKAMVERFKEYRRSTEVRPRGLPAKKREAAGAV